MPEDIREEKKRKKKLPSMYNDEERQMCKCPKEEVTRKTVKVCTKKRKRLSHPQDSMNASKKATSF
jgi:hypothetical protein